MAKAKAKVVNQLNSIHWKWHEILHVWRKLNNCIDLNVQLAQISFPIFVFHWTSSWHLINNNEFTIVWISKKKNQRFSIDICWNHVQLSNHSAEIVDLAWLSILAKLFDENQTEPANGNRPINNNKWPTLCFFAFIFNYSRNLVSSWNEKKNNTMNRMRAFCKLQWERQRSSMHVSFVLRHCFLSGSRFSIFFFLFVLHQIKQRKPSISRN